MRGEDFEGGLTSKGGREEMTSIVLCPPSIRYPVAYKVLIYTRYMTHVTGMQNRKMLKNSPISAAAQS